MKVRVKASASEMRAWYLDTIVELPDSLDEDERSDAIYHWLVELGADSPWESNCEHYEIDDRECDPIADQSVKADYILTADDILV